MLEGGGRPKDLGYLAYPDRSRCRNDDRAPFFLSFWMTGKMESLRVFAGIRGGDAKYRAPWVGSSPLYARGGGRPKDLGYLAYPDRSRRRNDDRAPFFLSFWMTGKNGVSEGFCTGSEAGTLSTGRLGSVPHLYMLEGGDDPRTSGT